MELRIQILLNVEDLDTVKSLVFASPEYHQAYLTIRHYILSMYLQKSYNGLVDTKDAVAAIRTRGMYAIYPSNRQSIIALLDAWRRCDEIRHLNLSDDPKILPDRPANVTEVIQLLHLHKSAMFFLEDYCTHAECPQWMESTKWHNEIMPLQLSRTEKRRFLRAFYRLQIYGNIFGDIDIPLDGQRPEKENVWLGSNWDRTNYTFSDVEFWRLMMAPMAPWEVEELGCFWQHCFNRLAKPYHEIANSLLECETRYQTSFINELPTHEQPPFERYYFDTQDLSVQDEDIRDSIISMGPSLLVKVLREADFMTRRNLVLVNSIGNEHVFPHIWHFNLNPRLDSLPLLYPADKFNFGTDFAGLERFLDSLPEHERPNTLWRQRWVSNQRILDYPEVFGDMFDYACRHARWDWGYAFWDDERVVQWEIPNMEERFPGNCP